MTGRDGRSVEASLLDDCKS